jgi:predicted PurR-regulated permease PerM
MAERPTSRVEKGTFGALFAVAGLLFLWTVSPLWVPVFLGILLAVIAWPLKRRAERSMGGHPRLLAVLITAVTMAIGAGLVAVVAIVIGREIVQFFSSGAGDYAHEADRLLHSRRAARALDAFGATPDQVVASAQHAARGLVTHVTDLVGGVASVTWQAVLTVFFTALTSYYLLLEGAAVKRLLLRLVPLPADELLALGHEFREASIGVLLSIGAVSVFQGVAAGAVFWACGVPKPLVWGALVVLTALIPGVGTALVCVPLGVLQIATGHVASGVALLIAWALVVVVFADYVLRPWVMRGRVRMPDLLVLIGVFGGLEAFGALGLALGPLFVALFVALVRIYDRDYRPRRRSSVPTPA